MSWLRQLFSRPRVYNDLSAEIQEHLEEKAAELVQAGMSREDALAAARRQFGNYTLLEERGREVWQWRWLEQFLRDFRFAWRQLARNTGFTVAAVLVLTLAIGANTAMFSMIDALLLRPLPYPHPERLAALVRDVSGRNSNGHFVSGQENGQDGETWELVRDNVSAAIMAAEKRDTNGINLKSGKQTRYVHDQRVSAMYFDALGIKPLLGRSFTQEEDRPSGPDVVILSYTLWKNLFSSDPALLGQSIRLKDVPYTVVGVMPASLQTTAQDADLWTPLRPSRNGEGEGMNYAIVLRLRDGATWAEVNAELESLHPSEFSEFAKHVPQGEERLTAVPLQKDLAREQKPPALMLMAAVCLILLIACANLAGLMLVRFTRRTSEIATRLALGATHGAIMRQVFAEPLLLSVMGGIAGLAAAAVFLKTFAAMLPPEMVPLGGLGIDARVMFLTLAAVVATALLIAIFPALAIRNIHITPSLAGRTIASTPRSSRARQILVGAEVALTLVLLAGAGLLIRTLIDLQNLPAGFDSHNVLTAKASLDEARYHDDAAFHRLLDESLAAMRRIPGVDSAAVGLSLPYERGLNDGFKVMDGPTAGTNTASSTAYVTPDYFHVLRIPVMAGRSFTDADTAQSEPVVIVNVSFAKKYLGSLDVVGRHLRLGKTPSTVVGVVGNVSKPPGINVQAPLSTEPMFYVPAAQQSAKDLQLIHLWFQPSWIVRTSGPVTGLRQAMQKALEQADPDLPFSAFHTLDELQGQALAQQHLEVVLLTVLAALALFLSLVGAYGLISNMVLQRRRDIGIRMALGCTVARAIRETTTSGLLPVAGGITAGLVLALFALRLMKSQLFGVRNLDPMTLLAVSLLMLCAAAVAGFLPSLQVARINPASTLRSE